MFWQIDEMTSVANQSVRQHNLIFMNVDQNIDNDHVHSSEETKDWFHKAVLVCGTVLELELVLLNTGTIHNIHWSVFSNLGFINEFFF